MSLKCPNCSYWTLSQVYECSACGVRFKWHRNKPEIADGYTTEALAKARQKALATSAQKVSKRERFFSSKSHTCPSCTNELQYDAPTCDACGVGFLWGGAPANKVWPRGKPEVSPAYQIEYYSDVLQERNLTSARFGELFLTWEHGNINPVAFLEIVLGSYRQQGIMTLEDAISYLIAHNLPSNPLKFQEVRKTVVTSFDSVYNSYLTCPDFSGHENPPLLASFFAKFPCYD